MEKETINITIEACYMCPFAFYDTSYYDSCNFPGNQIDLDILPDKGMPEKCPLRTANINIKSI